MPSSATRSTSGVRYGPRAKSSRSLDVIRKLGQEGKLLDLQDGGAHSDHLALMIGLLWLYDEYGAYSNFEETRVLNGPGVIDWQRTIDMETPVISDGAPIYLDLWTRKTRRDEYDLVMRLHRAILSESSRFLEGSGLSSLLSIGTAELTDENPTDIGETEYLQWLIDRERANQYVTWKQDVLDLMRSYLSERGADAERGRVLRLGTTSYYHAWEVACKTAFGDLLDYRLRELPNSTSQKAGLSESMRPFCKLSRGPFGRDRMAREMPGTSILLYRIPSPSTRLAAGAFSASTMPSTMSRASKGRLTGSLVWNR